LGLGLLVVAVLVGVIWFIQRGRGEPSAPSAVTESAPSAVTAMPATATAGPATATVTPEVAPPTAVVSIPVGVDDVPMVAVPAGQFLMGSTAADVMRWEKELPETAGYRDYTRDEWPQMVVYLDTFEIDQVEVTYARYMRCVNAGVCAPPQEWDSESSYQGSNHPDYPVRVKLPEAATYCQWVNKRLPTEMEWEKAARGTDGRIYPWGNEWDETRLHTDAMPAPVGSYPQGASPYGALDMVGNVGEWIAGTYSVYPGGLYTQTSALRRPDTGPVALYRGRYSGYDRTNSPPRLQYRVANRFRADDVAPLGFRCVRGSEPPPLTAALVSTENFAEPTPLAQVDLSGMVEIPAGEFLMGSAESEDYPLHTVYLDTFYIDQYETTSAEYVEFLNALGATYFACDGVTCTDLTPPQLCRQT